MRLLIHTGHTSKDFCHHLIVDGAQAFGYLLGCHSSLALASDQDHFIACARLRNMCHVNHALIHTNATKDRSFLPVNEDRTPIFGRTPETIGVADRQDRYESWPFCYIGTAIANTLACWHPFHLCYLRFE